MLKFYCIITGDEYNLVKDETPQSKKKVKLLAFSIMVPVIFWAVNSFLLSSVVLMKDLPTSLLVMVICSAIIFIIEKIIVMSNGGKGIAAFRFLIGLIIALSGSLSLEEVVFKNDIDTQMAENRRIYVKGNLDIKKEELEKELSKMESEVNVKDSIWKEAVNAAIGEIEGTSGSKVPYRGPIADFKILKADELKTDRENAINSLKIFKSQNDLILNVYESEISNGYGMNSLLLRVKALFDLVGKDNFMLLFFILFTALLLLMESMVIVIKLLSKDTNYEMKMKMIEQIGEKRMMTLVNNNAQVYDPLIFKGDIMKRTEILKRPMNGVYK